MTRLKAGTWPYLDLLKTAQELQMVVETLALDFAAKVPAIPERVLREELGQLLQGFLGLHVALQLRVQNLLQLPGQDGATLTVGLLYTNII